ncbi:hypothetical protein ACFOKF_19505 [Sphingobium rhizovicinum]|uniref:Transposase n=1 Tax=Sphingobium rhizovicinum TaxID=432308 RepID=A0ABV7NIM6_9SPHN
MSNINRYTEEQVAYALKQAELLCLRSGYLISRKIISHGAAGAAKMPGWWVSTAQAANANTIFRTFPPTRRSRTSLAPPRRAGSANKRISNSRTLGLNHSERRS